MDISHLTKAEQAISEIIQFPIAINQIAKQVARTSLGPWKIDVHCHYDDDCKKEHYTYPVYFSTKPLTQALTNSENYSKTFFLKFQSILNWLQDTLPELSKTFGNSSKVIQQILSKAQTNNQLTFMQTMMMNEALAQINGGLTRSLEQLKQGDASMASYLLQIKQLNKIVNQEKENLETHVQNVLNKMISWTKERHCGQSEAKRQFGTIESEYTDTVQTFNTQFSHFNQLSTQLSNSVGTLIGIVTDYITQVNEILKDLKNVEKSQFPIFIKKVDLLVAQNIWAKLESSASMSFKQHQASFDIAVSKLEK